MERQRSERAVLLRMSLAASEWRLRGAAKWLGVASSTMGNLLRSHGIERPVKLPPGRPRASGEAAGWESK
jgi:transcriptional regulator with GAF, ATPase, and Fis domain